MRAIASPHFDSYDFDEDSGYVLIQRMTPWAARKKCRELGMTHRIVVESFSGGSTNALRNIRMAPWAAYTIYYQYDFGTVETGTQVRHWPRPRTLSCFHFSSESDMNHFLVLWRLGHDG